MSTRLGISEIIDKEISTTNISILRIFERSGAIIKENHKYFYKHYESYHKNFFLSWIDGFLPNFFKVDLAEPGLMKKKLF